MKTSCGRSARRTKATEVTTSDLGAPDDVGRIERERLTILDWLAGKWVEKELSMLSISLGGSWGVGLYTGYYAMPGEPYDIPLWVVTYKMRIVDVFRDDIPKLEGERRREMKRAFGTYYAITQQEGLAESLRRQGLEAKVLRKFPGEKEWSE